MAHQITFYIYAPLRIEFDPMEEKRKRKNPAAVALGRRGGKKAAQDLTPEQRSEMARKAVQARWAKAKREGPKNDK